MQSSRVCPSQIYRITKTIPVFYNNTRTMSFFPRFAQVGGEFAPLFRLLDDYATHQVSRSGIPTSSTTPIRTFQPRFDVREVKDAYELHGELPGVDQSNIAIEFTDPQTLSIKGRSERHIESGTPPSATEPQPQQAALTSDASSETNNFHKATVEDDAAVSGALPDASETESIGTPTPAETPQPEKQQQVQQQPQQTQRPSQSRYWVSERSIGEFSRTFNFPSRVDQESVKASLRNGILSVVVPKAAAPALRRIQVE